MTTDCSASSGPFETGDVGDAGLSNGCRAQSLQPLENLRINYKMLCGTMPSASL
ncbi:MAG: hypothetical protein ABW224_12705 [Kibdelosporangium sp.]